MIVWNVITIRDIKHMKIIFLDVDGVLNTSRATTVLSLSRGAIKRLQGIIEATEAKIVLSSTWRIRDTSQFGAEPYNKLVKALKYRGLELYGETPRLSQLSKSRGHEINEWLKDAGPIDKYAIVDDDSDMLPHQLPHFFQTDPDYGLTETIAYRITTHLS